MNRTIGVTLLLVAFTVAGGGGYWFGKHGFRKAEPSIFTVPVSIQEDTHEPVIYYRDPDNKPYYSLLPHQTADGRAYRSIFANEDISFAEGNSATVNTATIQPEQRQVIYYRHPMGLPDISPTPKKDSMGMDYIPVYEAEGGDDSTFRISPGKVQEIGVKSVAAEMRVITEPVRAVGTIQLDERRLAVISLRSEAFVETVEDITTGSEISLGQPLMHIYSPAVTAAAAEYLNTLNLGSNEERLRGARRQLLNLAVPEEYLKEIESTRKVPLTFTWFSPRDGIVLERNVVEGLRVMPEDVLFSIADHSTVWALVDVAERDLAVVETNQLAVVKVRSYPDRTFTGRIELTYPHLNPVTRTMTVRIEIANPDFLLRPDMYAEAEIDISDGQSVLAVPNNAVMYSGVSQYVFIDMGEGRFEPRSVQLGRHGTDYVEIREGISEGDKAVISANFLIDAESNLKSAFNSLVLP